MTIPISRVSLGREEEDLVLQVLRSGRLAQGPMVEALEDAFAPWAGVEHVVAVTNGTVALACALQALGLKPGDEVITSPFTFVGTLSAILASGLTVRFADIGPDFLIDPDAVRSLVGSRTVALMPVHIFGQPANMLELGNIARRHGLALVEDAAQAHGATIDRRFVGSFGIGAFSLYATKNITAGEGGLVTTNDEGVARALRLIRNHGMRQRYEYELVGGNHRMTELQAAVALPQVRRMQATIHARHRNAARLTQGLSAVPGLSTPRLRKGTTHVWHQYTVRLHAGHHLSRDELANELARRGVETGVYYPRPVFDYACFSELPNVVPGDVPETRRLANECLSLPVHPGVTAPQIEHIVQSTRSALDA